MKKVICSNCGHINENTAVDKVDIYFPNRRLRGVSGKTISCLSCGEDNDLTIFGEQWVSCIHNVRLLELPNVKENNRIYIANKSIAKLRDGVRKKDKREIQDALNIVEDHPFLWEGLDGMLNEWNNLIKTANELI